MCKISYRLARYNVIEAGGKGKGEARIAPRDQGKTRQTHAPRARVAHVKHASSRLAAKFAESARALLAAAAQNNCVCAPSNGVHSFNTHTHQNISHNIHFLRDAISFVLILYTCYT